MSTKSDKIYIISNIAVTSQNVRCAVSFASLNSNIFKIHYGDCINGLHLEFDTKTAIQCTTTILKG